MIDIQNLPTIVLSPKQKNLTGQKKGKLIYLKPSRKVGKRTYWWMQCECGEIVEKRIDAESLSCPNCAKQHKKEILSNKLMNDLTGQKFNKLTVLYLKEKQYHKIIWHCKCDCGNECDVSSSSLISGNTKSCGCLKKKNSYFTNFKKDLTGLKFQYLTVLEETDKRIYGKIIWKCQCDCGNIVFLNTSSLTSGNTTSCGCKTQSLGALNIENILKENNIKYKKEYVIHDLLGHRFDFAIINNDDLVRLIEFDGEQHYKSTGGWNSPEALKIRQKQDKIKNEYAISHNIPLVRIPYWERDNITLDLLLGDKYLISN